MFGEQMLFTTERPIGQRIMTMSIACEQIANPAELEDVPVLSTRVIPSSEEGRPPSVAELVRLDVDASLHKSADGTPQLYTGRASLTMDARSPVDPWHLLAPTRVVQGWYGVFDFDLYHGKVVHDYLADEAIWSQNGVVAGAAAVS
jgi:acetoacetate decarboxylase